MNGGALGISEHEGANPPRTGDRHPAFADNEQHRRMACALSAFHDYPILLERRRSLTTSNCATAASVLVAAVVGGLEVLNLIGDQLGHGRRHQ